MVLVDLQRKHDQGEDGGSGEDGHIDGHELFARQDVIDVEQLIANPPH